MVYDDSRFRGEPGFRDEPEFRSGGVPEDAPMLGGPVGSMYTPGAYPVAEYGPPPSEAPLGMGARRGSPSAAQLDEVFDDPDHGDPGRDRMAVHLLWELVLLLGAAALAYLLRDAEPAALRGSGLREVLLLATELGLLTVAIGLSLRAAAPNLAVGPLAFAAALFFADNADRGLATTAGVTALLAVAVGVALAVLVVGFHVPGWAASLAVAFALLVWVQQHRPEKVVNGAYDPTGHAMYWFTGFVALALIGGLLGLAKPIRRAVGRFRPVGDPARRRGAAAATLTALALVGSTLLAAVGGVLIALDARAVAPTDGGLLAQQGLALSGLALGVALLGGTSAFGRRGGVVGTVLAVVMLTLLLRYASAERWNISSLAIAAGTIVAGLIITRLIETFGRPRSVVEDEPVAEWVPATGSPADGWSGSRTGGWSSQLPARATDEGWGTEERWSAR